jgi:hypothetical protein
VDRPRIGMPLQRAEHASAEVDDQRRSVRCPQQVTRCRRIRADDAPRAAEHGNSHGHYCAMPGVMLLKTSAVLLMSKVPRCGDVTMDRLDAGNGRTEEPRRKVKKRLRIPGGLEHAKRRGGFGTLRVGM